MRPRTTTWAWRSSAKASETRPSPPTAALKADPSSRTRLQLGAARPRGVVGRGRAGVGAPAHFDPRALRRVGLLPAPHKPQVVPAVRELVSWFGARGVAVLLHQDQAAEFGFAECGVPQAQLAEESDLLLALGGDGTLLHTARLGAPLGKPILGVNLGGFGFLAAVPHAGLYPFLEALLEGRVKLQARMMLRPKSSWRAPHCPLPGPRRFRDCERRDLSPAAYHDAHFGGRGFRFPR